MVNFMAGIILPYRGVTPKIHDSVFVVQNAAVIGDVEIGAECGIWFAVTVRGDVNDIKIGKRTNIQDGTVIHVTTDFSGTYIGNNVTVGHSAVLHACTIEDEVLIGMQTCVMDGAVVETRSMVAAGSLVTPGKRVKTGELWAGRPAQYMRDLKKEELEYIDWSAKHYAQLAKEYHG